MTYHKLLIANRGDIACRIMKTAHEMGISCVAVYTDADSESPFVKLADEAIKLTDTYLNGKEIIEAARQIVLEKSLPPSTAPLDQKVVDAIENKKSNLQKTFKG